MKEEWLMPGAIVPVNPDTTKALVDEIKRLIGVIGGMALQQAEKQEPVACSMCNEWEKVCDQHLRHITKLKKKRTLVGLTDDEMRELTKENIFVLNAIIATNAKLKEKNHVN